MESNQDTHVIINSNNFVFSTSKNLKIKIPNIIISPVELYGFRTWFLTLREDADLVNLRTRSSGQYLGPNGMRIGVKKASK